MSGNPLNVTEPSLNTIEEAIADIRDGKIIIVVDDEDRENEGDFICAAERVTPELITFMATHGRGLICTPIEEDRADDLDLPMMVSSNTALHETAFTVSIDLIGHGCTTGISSYDRSTGIKRLTSKEAKKTDFARPGHIFPLRAKKGGVLRRTGHTEAAVDLARMAGLYPAGVLVEILNADGTMARVPQLLKIAEKHDLKMISIKDLVAYRMRTERLVEKEIEMEIDTAYGQFTLHAYRQTTNEDIHIALTHGSWLSDEPVLTRVHSSTTSHDLLHRLMSDFGTGLSRPLKRISEEGKGVLLFMRPHQEPGEIINELKVLKSRLEEGLDIGHEGQRSMSQRDFGVGAQILRDLQVSKLRILSKSPKKRVGIIGYGLEVVEDVAL
ncbi:3,4-dihydroxy-2-butanone-4-phosphate synthase [Lewinellaceae bacterium SD302]|nr:3,4-dihydroxy-2-butanone-4-phosphate synthase [Lewinellaceae bacterium SD302]